VERRQLKFLQSNVFFLLVIVERHVQAVVSSVVLIERPTTYHPQTVQRDVVHVAHNDQHVPGHFADVPQERHVIAGVGQEHELQVAVDIRTVGIACSILVVVALGVTQTRLCTTAYYTHTSSTTDIKTNTTNHQRHPQSLAR